MPDVLVRVDILEPYGSGWRAIEMKASTRVKAYQLAGTLIDRRTSRLINRDEERANHSKRISAMHVSPRATGR